MIIYDDVLSLTNLNCKAWLSIVVQKDKINNLIWFDLKTIASDSREKADTLNRQFKSTFTQDRNEISEMDGPEYS